MGPLEDARQRARGRERNVSYRTLDLRELAGELADLRERDGDPDTSEPLDDDDRERFKAIEEIERDLGCGDLASYAADEPLAIREDDFAEYAEELAEEIGAIQRGASWPNNCIDWKRAADELAVDYSSFTFEGDTYLVRSR